MGLLDWIFSMVVVLSLWEYFTMGLDWHSVTVAQSWTTWGLQTEGGLVTKWSYRLGPLEIFKML